MPNPPLSEEERKRRKQALNRKRSHADVYKRKLEKEKSLMDKLTEDQRVEQRRLTALRRSAENARAYRKRTIADLRSKLKVEKKKVRAAGSMLKVPSTPEMCRELREHGLHVDDNCEVCSFLFL